MKKMLAAECVLDFDLYPRNNVDSSNVSRIMMALEAGHELPPVVIDRKTKRVIDGFHRIRATLRVFGAEAMIAVIEKDYASEKEMFLDAVRYNAHHGAPLDSADRTRCLIMAERLRISLDSVAQALSVKKSKLSDMKATRIGTANGIQIPLKRTISAQFAGEKLTPIQVEANTKLSGMSQAFYVNQVITLIEADMLDSENEYLMERLKVLHGLLDGVLAAL